MRTTERDRTGYVTFSGVCDCGSNASGSGVGMGSVPVPYTWTRTSTGNVTVNFDSALKPACVVTCANTGANTLSIGPTLWSAGVAIFGIYNPVGTQVNGIFTFTITARRLN